MRLLPLSAVVVLCGIATGQDSAVPLIPSVAAPGDITVRDRFHILVRNTVGLGSVAANVASAGIAQWLNEPPEWGQGAEGHGKRVGHRFAAQAVAGGLEFGASSALHEDLRYFRSTKKGFWPRSGDILRQTLDARTPGGGRRPAISRFIGAYGSALISGTWYPGSTLSDKFLNGTANLGAVAGANAFKEFWPDIRRKLFHKP